MNYGQIILNDIANGEGIRISLFVSGCDHKCPGCFQPETWNKDYGQPFTNSVLKYLIEELNKPQYDGLTLLGGDPLFESNRKEVLRIVKTIKKQCKDRTIWLYTGSLYEDIKDQEIMKYIDVVVDGPFIEEQKDIRLQYRGSTNQRIIYIH